MNKFFLALALIALFSIASATRAEAISSLWGIWKTAHKKQYSPSEEPHRLSIFLSSIEKIARLNANYPTAKFGLNQFADLTDAEYKAKYAGALLEPVKPEEIIEIPVNGELPESVDWRTKGAVTPVKDQGTCGSCWAFSAVGLLEGFYFINNGKLLSFSEQQMVDCAKVAGMGCSGGFARTAVDYVVDSGLEVEADYPYIGKVQQCQYDSSKVVKVCSGGGKYITPRSSEQLKAALVNGPVSVSVDSSDDVWKFYKSGVITSGCGIFVNHSVLAVGYEKVDGIEAFIVKNSYGTSWGNEGYVAVSTDQSINDGEGACSILSVPLIAF